MNGGDSMIDRIVKAVAPIFLLTASLHPCPASAGGGGKAVHPEVDFGRSCTECHLEVTPEVVEAWKGSKHGLMNFGCYMCHGDGTEYFEAAPSTVRCASCHGKEEIDFRVTRFESCFDCHDGHTLGFHRKR